MKVEINANIELSENDLKAKVTTIGLDTNIIIDMILVPQFVEIVCALSISQEGYFTISSRVYNEVISILKYEYSYIKEPKQKIKGIIKKLKIKVLNENSNDKAKANLLFYEHGLEDYNSIKDMSILSTFLRNKVSHLICGDREFNRIAKAEGMNIVKINRPNRPEPK